MATETNGANGNGQPVLNEELLDRFQAIHNDLVGNALLARQEFFNRILDPRRSVEDECGFPPLAQNILPETYQELYERNSVAARVVECLPRETWQIRPTVHETADAERETEFEKAWDNLSQTIVPEQDWYQDEEGGIVWEYLRRADEQCGIGHFGVILLGFDDGQPLGLPVAGDIMMPTQNVSRAINKGQLPTFALNCADGRRAEEMPVTVNQIRLFNADGRPNLLDSKMINPPQLLGTDAQYAGVQFYEDVLPKRKKSDKRQVRFLRVFPEYLVQVIQYESNLNNPRFGMPVRYAITLNDPREQHTGVGLPIATVYVHWTRVIHLVSDDMAASEIFSIPRMRPVLNNLLGLHKLYGASPEAYWKSCFSGLSFETHPQLGGDVKLNASAMRDMVENYQNSLQKYLVLMGMSAKTLAPAVIDPATHIAAQIEAICIKLGIPVRVFKGSERGELASSQDDAAFNDRLRARQEYHVTPRIISPFVRRLIATGVLPEPKGYSVHWADLDAQTDAQKAQIALQKTQAIQAFVMGQVESVMSLNDYYTRILGFSPEQAEAIIEATQDTHENEDTFTMPPAGEQGHPATPPEEPEPPPPPQNGPPPGGGPGGPPQQGAAPKQAWGRGFKGPMPEGPPQGQQQAPAQPAPAAAKKTSSTRNTLQPPVETVKYTDDDEAFKAAIRSANADYKKAMDDLRTARLQAAGEHDQYIDAPKNEVEDAARRFHDAYQLKASNKAKQTKIATKQAIQRAATQNLDPRPAMGGWAHEAWISTGWVQGQLPGGWSPLVNAYCPGAYRDPTCPPPSGAKRQPSEHLRPVAKEISDAGDWLRKIKEEWGPHALRAVGEALHLGKLETLDDVGRMVAEIGEHLEGIPYLGTAVKAADEFSLSKYKELQSEFGHKGATALMSGGILTGATVGVALHGVPVVGLFAGLLAAKAPRVLAHLIHSAIKHHHARERKLAWESET
jgi:hypothetical protein